MFEVFERSNEIGAQIEKFSPPKFSRAMEDQTVLAGESAIFAVSAHGVPQPEITFYKNGQKFNEINGQYEILHDEMASADDYWLILRNAVLTDDAEYACQAKNVAGEAWSFADLFVLLKGFVLSVYDL